MYMIYIYILRQIDRYHIDIDIDKDLDIDKDKYLDMYTVIQYIMIQ